MGDIRFKDSADDLDDPVGRLYDELTERGIDLCVHNGQLRWAADEPLPSILREQMDWYVVELAAIVEAEAAIQRILGGMRQPYRGEAEEFLEDLKDDKTRDLHTTMDLVMSDLEALEGWASLNAELAARGVVVQ